MRYGLLTQLLLIIISITLALVYIRPTLASIRVVQDELFEYSDAVAKAEEFNQRLRELLTIEKSFSAQNIASLNEFLPETIDTVQVMRDIEFIALQSNVTLGSIGASETVSPTQEFTFEDELPESPTLPYVDFTVDVTGSYNEVKNFLANVETNSYILEIVALDLAEVPDNTNTAAGARSSVSPTSAPFGANVTLRAFSLVDQNNNQN